MIYFPAMKTNCIDDRYGNFAYMYLIGISIGVPVYRYIQVKELLQWKKLFKKKLITTY